MRPRRLLILGVGLTVATAAAVMAGLVSGPAPAVAQLHKPPAPLTPTPPAAPPPAGHADSDLDCRQCHRGNHRGTVQMYLGMGGRGAPKVPSHMFELRVECVACHTTPTTATGGESIVGQTFRPSEQACVNCHGEKYRGLIVRWSETLARMRGIVVPKLDAVRAALVGTDAKAPKVARARKLTEDADFNVRFVSLAKGVHNVFYAADLLKVANGWIDESAALLGKTPRKTDDQLVRGGYCAVLCHEAAGVRMKQAVVFGKRTLPHARHVIEFGATCTSCHSAETHKAVTATAATCAGCHHGPQNDRCETCHRAQAAFYRGQASNGAPKIAPNVMADAVSCTGCHDFSRKHSREAVGRACLKCHEPVYAALLTEWTKGFDADLRTTQAALRGAEAAAAGARGSGGTADEIDVLIKEARGFLAAVVAARPAHNPLAADALLAQVRAKADDIQKRVGKARSGR